MSGLLGSSINSGLSSSRSSNRSSDEARKDVKPLQDIKISNTFESDVVVYLVRKPLYGSKSETAAHWHLVFYFEDSELYVVYEAGDENGKLTPRRRACGSLSESYEQEQKVKLDQIGTLFISQAALHRAAVENRLNNTPYCVGTNNCQNWVKVFCDILGISKELESLPTFSSTLKKADAVLGTSLVGSFTGSFGSSAIGSSGGSAVGSASGSALWSSYHKSKKM